MGNRQNKKSHHKLKSLNDLNVSPYLNEPQIIIIDEFMGHHTWVGAKIKRNFFEKQCYTRYFDVFEHFSRKLTCSAISRAHKSANNYCFKLLEARKDI